MVFRWFQVIPGVYKVCSHLPIVQGPNLNHLQWRKCYRQHCLRPHPCLIYILELQVVSGSFQGVSGDSRCVQGVYTSAYCPRTQSQSSEMKKMLYITLPKTSSLSYLNFRISGCLRWFSGGFRWFQVCTRCVHICLLSKDPISIIWNKENALYNIA